LCRNGDLGVGLSIRRVDAVTGLRGGRQLIVDDIVERLDLLDNSDRGVGMNTVMSNDMMMNWCVDGVVNKLEGRYYSLAEKMSLKYVAQAVLLLDRHHHATSSQTG
jgi:hypothetical protein